jgi:Sulfotransferase domain
MAHRAGDWESRLKDTAKKPDFFLAGAPRTGTTSMFTYLSLHPEIFIPGAKELNFFGSDLHHVVRPGQRRKTSTPAGPEDHGPLLTLDEYLRFFVTTKPAKRMGDCSVAYFFSQKAAKEIKEFNPSARIILMVRDPVEMIYSWYYYQVMLGVEKSAGFDEALNAEEKRKRGADLPAPSYLLEGFFYREIARIGEHVERYLSAFGPERVHVIIYDDFRNDTASAYQQTLRFLDVDPKFQLQFETVNANPQVRFTFLRNLLKKPPSFVAGPIRRLMSRSLREDLARPLWRLALKRKPRPQMNPELRRRLQAEFAPEVERLSELLGRDLTYWSTPEPARETLS